MLFGSLSFGFEISASFQTAEFPSLGQRQHFRLGGTKRVAQFLHVGHPDPIESNAQLRRWPRLVFQKELDVRQVFRSTSRVVSCRASWAGNPSARAARP